MATEYRRREKTSALISQLDANKQTQRGSNYGEGADVRCRSPVISQQPRSQV